MLGFTRFGVVGSWRRLAVVMTLLAATAGCSDSTEFFPDTRRGDGGGEASSMDDGVPPFDADERDTYVPPIDVVMDAPPDVPADSDAMNMYMPETGPGCDGGTPAMCTPMPTGCGPTEICGDGLDNNCNRAVDESCACLPGTVQTCFAGPPGSRRIGACSDGTQRCVGSGEFGTWGPCTGGISPSGETCDMLDNDCNGCRDEGLCCGGMLTCPGPGDPRIPTARPFETVRIDGTTIYRAMARAWRWEITGGPCESILPTPTFTTGSLTDPTLVFTPALSGDYTITLRITTADGTMLMCTFVVHVAGEGLRVEMCWRPTSGATSVSDLDLYLHEPDTMTPWFSGMGNVVLPGVTLPNSCNWANCGPALRGLPRVNWGYAPGPLVRCQDGPGGATWRTLGNCPNPRIDVDGHGLASEPRHGYIENINADQPRNAQRFRIMVHDCSGPSTNPLVNVYCGGFLRATIGAAPETVTLPGGGSCSANADTIWRVADVVVNVDAAGVTTGCTVTPIRLTGGGPRLTRGDLSY